MKTNHKGQFERNKEGHIEDVINAKYAKYEYVGGYKGIDGFIYLMCKDCGHTFKYTAQITRPSRNRVIECKRCNVTRRETKRLEEQRAKAILREQKRKRKESLRLQQLREKQVVKKCYECNKEFTTTSDAKYCSTKCMKRANDYRKSLRKRKRAMTNGDVDWSISLAKLIKKETNVCHICGEKCDSNDYIINENGAFIAGNRHPSIDHVMPIAKGGTHTWDNVRLAHRQCNSIKSDNAYYEDGNNQITMAI